MQQTGRDTRNQAAINGVAIQGNSNSITLTDQGAIATAGELLKHSLDVAAASAAAGQAAVADAIDQLGALSETKVTDGANLISKNTMVAVVAFAVVGLVAFLFLRK